MTEEPNRIDKKGPPPFLNNFIASNRSGLLILAFLNVGIGGLVLVYSHEFVIEFASTLFTTGMAILGITTATVAFYGSQVEREISRLFVIKGKITVVDISSKLAKRYLWYLFLQFVLLWAFLLIALAIGFASVAVFFSYSSNIVKISLALLLMSVSTLVLWVVLYFESNTPGKQTYLALTDTEVTKTELK